jgi:glutamine synthetase
MSDHGHLQEANDFLSQNPEIKAVDLLISDLNGIARGKRIEQHALTKIFTEGVNLPSSVFSMNILGETIEECGLGLEVGEPDLVCKPVANTLHLASWHKRPTGQLLMSMYNKDGSPFHADPRHILASICNKLAELKLTAVVAVELEFYLFDKVRDSQGRVQAPISPKSGKRDQHTQVYSVDTLADYSDFLEDISNACVEQNVPADTAVAECAPGQFEINLKHQADPLLACDNAILLKRIIKAIADKHNFDVSFMAKPYGDEAGSGMHVHVSLVDDEGNNVFADQKKDYNQTLEHAIGGLLELMPASMPVLCPNINSYRRFQPQF